MPGGGGDVADGRGCRASFSSVRRPLTSSRSTKNCKVGITFDAAPAPAPAPAERTGSARRGFSLSGRSSGASDASSEADKLVAQHEEGRLRRQRQAEAYKKA